MMGAEKWDSDSFGQNFEISCNFALNTHHCGSGRNDLGVAMLLCSTATLNPFSFQIGTMGHLFGTVVQDI